MAAKRYNKGKTRFGMLPTKPLEYLADVYTRGAHKYSVYEDEEGNQFLGKDIPLEEVYKYKLIESGADNWRKGLPWMDTLDSVERHIEAWKGGEDLDQEIKTYHLANAAWGLFSILEFYKTHPEMDDRPLSVLKPLKIGLDIDGVLADFTGHLTAKMGFPDHQPQHWNDPMIRFGFEQVKNDDNFWATIPVKTQPKDIPFEPHCYITARSTGTTQEWLDKNGFPTAPLYVVGHDQSKIDIAKTSGIDVFIDDRYENFVELTNAGIFTYLFDAPYNRHYNVGHRRCYSLKDLKR